MEQYSMLYGTGLVSLIHCKRTEVLSVLKITLFVPQQSESKSAHTNSKWPH